MTNTNRTHLFWAFALILVGLLFLLSNFDLIPGTRRDWWPVLAMGAGLWLLVQASARRGQGLAGGLVLTCLGTFWLLENRGVVPGEAFLPVLLIALGGGLLARAFWKSRG
jgi:hypothetical protein